MRGESGRREGLTHEHRSRRGPARSRSEIDVKFLRHESDRRNRMRRCLGRDAAVRAARRIVVAIRRGSRCGGIARELNTFAIGRRHEAEAEGADGIGWGVRDSLGQGDFVARSYGERIGGVTTEHRSLENQRGDGLIRTVLVKG